MKGDTLVFYAYPLSHGDSAYGPGLHQVGVLMASIDLSEAYLLVSSHKDSQNFFALPIGVLLSWFLALCFVAVTAPQVFSLIFT